MMEVACECEEGFGAPHSHVHTVTLRNTTDGREIHLQGYVSHQNPQWLWVSEEWSIRYWHDEVTVDTDDVLAVLALAALNEDSDPEEGERVRAAAQPAIDKLKVKIESLNRPTLEERLSAQ